MSPFITSVVASDPTNFVLTRGANGCLQIGPAAYITGSSSTMYLGQSCSAASSYVQANEFTAIYNITANSLGSATGAHHPNSV
jgi:hypothetical protein